MADIIKEILKHLPSEKISDANYEGANIVLYTKDRDFFLNNNGIIKKIVDEFKKRIELRADIKICVPKENTEKEIKKILPEEAGISNIIFDPQRSSVIIEAEKPGLAIGKQGNLLREIKEKTFWIPSIRRTPAIRSQIIEDIRQVLYKHGEERKKFLDKVGHRIYDGWIRGKKSEWVRLTHLGAARQVGRSSLLVQTPESRVLLDCGINVAGEGSEAYPHLEVPEFDISQLDAVILTHAHLDHSGFIPYLFKFGYRGPVYCTEPTRDVAALLALDFIKIMKSENKDPIYDSDDVKAMVQHTICLDFDEVSDITPDVRLTLYNAGHIIGSAMAHLHIGNGLHNMLFTGDLKYGKTILLDSAVTQFPRLESVIMESTYGGRTNVLPPQKEQDDYLKKLIKDTVERNGKVLMPVLGVGRAQDMMILIDNMIRTGEIKEIPVYIDGMVWDITAIHTAYPEYLNSNIRKLIFHKDQNPFLNPSFKRIGSGKERMKLIEDHGPCVILATSGMLVGGPSVEYLRYLGDNPRNTLIFSCYQGPGSLGSRILYNGERDLIFKSGRKQEIVPLKMEIAKLEITDHSDRKQLMNFVFKLQPRPKKIILQHGESSKILDLSSSIHKQLRIETIAPRNLETIRLR
jgi:uncharacterized protein